MKAEMPVTQQENLNTPRVLLLLLLVALVLGIAPAAQAQDGEPSPGEGDVTDDAVNAVAEQLYCPVCENVPLDVCGTQACADWREEIRTMLAEGRSEDEVKAYFAERYGRRVLAMPDARGIDVAVWILPPVGVLIGAAVLLLAIRRMAPGALATEGAEAADLVYPDLDPEYVARLEREIEEFA